MQSNTIITYAEKKCQLIFFGVIESNFPQIRLSMSVKLHDKNINKLLSDDKNYLRIKVFNISFIIVLKFVLKLRQNLCLFLNFFKKIIWPFLIVFTPICST